MTGVYHMTSGYLLKAPRTLWPEQNACQFANTLSSAFFFLWIFFQTYWINVGLMPPGKKPLPDPVLTQIHDAKWHCKATVGSPIEVRWCIYALESGHHSFKLWLVACYTPRHYLNQCWLIVSWTLRHKLQWNLNQNIEFLFQEIAF